MILQYLPSLTLFLWSVTVVVLLPDEVIGGTPKYDAYERNPFWNLPTDPTTTTLNSIRGDKSLSTPSLNIVLQLTGGTTGGQGGNGGTPISSMKDINGASRVHDHSMMTDNEDNQKKDIAVGSSLRGGNGTVACAPPGTQESRALVKSTWTIIDIPQQIGIEEKYHADRQQEKQLHSHERFAKKLKVVHDAIYCIAHCCNETTSHLPVSHTRGTPFITNHSIGINSIYLGRYIMQALVCSSQL